MINIIVIVKKAEEVTVKKKKQVKYFGVLFTMDGKCGTKIM